MLFRSLDHCKAVLRRRGLDRATAYATLAHLISLSFGPVTAFFVATQLQPELQGYYYTFGSLTTVQVLFAAGLNQVVMQVASHEWSRLKADPKGRLEGDERALARLSTLFSVAVRWYAALALALGTSLLVLGWVVFSGHSSQDAIGWRSVWMLLSLAACMTFVLTPAWAVLQGCGQVRQYYVFHCVHLALNAVVLWVSLSLGFGLWSLPAAAIVGVAWSVLFLTLRYRHFFRSLRRARSVDVLSWQDEVWPLQWRSWLTWASTTLTVQALIPICFRLEGAVAAGRLGMTVTLTNVITAMALSPVTTKAPMMGALVASERFDELNSLYWKAIRTSAAFLGVGLVAVAAGFAGAVAAGVNLVTRVLPAPSLSLMMLAAAGLAVSGWMTAYVRAFKREPFVPTNTLWSLVTLAVVPVLSKRVPGGGAPLAYSLTVLGVLLPMTAYTFFRHRQLNVRACVPGTALTTPQ